MKRLLALLAAVSLANADTLDHIGSDELALEAALLLQPTQTARALMGVQAAGLPANTGGTWSNIISWTPHIPVSAANLPDGRLLTFASNQRTTFPAGPEFTYAAVWNPTTGTFTEINNPRHDMFCGSLVMLPDGRVHIAGERSTTVLSSIFDWRTNAWSAIPNMNDPRWYNTAVALPNGTAVTFSGSGGSNTVERWSASSGWARLTGIPWSQVTSEPGYLAIWHPFLSLAPNGQLIHFGPTDTMHWVNVSGTGSMTNTGNTVPGNHYPKEGCWTMFEEGRILVMGGSSTTSGSDATAGNQSNAAYVVDVRGANPVVTSTASMRFGRQFANCAVLPNGEVMVMGGNSGTKFSDSGSVLAPEIWSPTTGTWREVTDMKTPRNYHSVALLLKDGRVISGGGGLGGGDHQDAEIYTPSNLYTSSGTLAARPAITTAPSTIGVGSQFNVSATAGLSSFALIKLSAITHSVNTDLRRLVVPHTEISSGQYRLTFSSNVNVLTPGYWYLFGLNSAGVWSEAAILLVDATTSVSVNQPASQSSFVGTAVNVPMTATAPAGSTLTWSAAGRPPGITINASTGVFSGTPTTVGTYSVTVSASNGTSSSSSPFTWTVFDSQGTGIIKREWWLNIPNSDLLSLTSDPAYPSSPTGTDNLTSFETPTDWQDNMGQRLRGYLRPTVTGQYRFWIAGDDESRLILSTSTAVSTNTIARVPIWTSSREWTKFPEQQSALITLTAGQVYYIEALMKEGGGGDNLAVAWALPGTSTPVVIPGSALSLQPPPANVAPVVSNPGSRTNVTGTATTLQVQATDANANTLTYSATGLPTGVTISSSTGLISGTPTASGTFNTVLSVTDNIATAVTASFTWTIVSPLTIGTLSGAPINAGAALPLTIASSGGISPAFTWDFGDGGSTNNGQSVSHTYVNPGRYLINVTATDSTGRLLTASYFQTVRSPATASVAQSSPIAREARTGSSSRIWVVNPDNDTVSVIDAGTNTRVAEIAVGAHPTSVFIIQGTNTAWVTNSRSDTVSVIDRATLAISTTISLPRGAKPYGIAQLGTSAWVTLEALGQVLRYDSATRALISTVNVGANPRGVSVVGNRVLVSRFITPLLPGESTATITTTSSAGGQVVSIDATTNAIATTIVLQHSERPDTSLSSRGVPNYLGAPVISPDGSTAWIPSKQDNIKRGMLRDGQQLTHDSAVRSIASIVNLATNTENLAGRVDFNDAGIAKAAAMDDTGAYLFVALEGGREVAIVDAFNRAEVIRFTTGRAPQGVVYDVTSRRVYAFNFMDRTVTAHDVAALQNGSNSAITTLATINTTSTERLTAAVLNGKQLFYDTRDNRLALQQYISCASCHDDGGHDGRVWDFTGFGEGLRNTITLQGTSGMGHGPVHWTGNFDEIQDFENQIRTFAGGTGLISGGSPHAPLSTPNAGRSTDLDALAQYLSTLSSTDVSPFKNADGTLTTAAAAGKIVFQNLNCAQCHTGTKFTNSALNTFANVGTITSSTGQRLGAALTGLDVPTIRGLWASAPYLHNGSASTLTAAINAHNTPKPIGTDLTNLAAYLGSIDAGETTAPVLAAPTVSLAAPSSTTGAFTVTISANQTISGLTSSDFTIANGTAGALTGSGSSYGLVVNPTTAGNVTVSLPAGSATNAANGGNLASNTTTTVYTIPDTTKPAATLSTASANVTGAFTVTASFSESVTGLALGDFVVSNGTAANLTGNSVTITPTSAGTVSIQLPAGAVSDAAGNTSTASNTLSVSYAIPDTTPPSVVLSTASSNVTAPFTVTATFSETVTGLALTDFLVTNGTASTLTGTTVTITPTAAGTVSVQLQAGAVIDAASNGSTASNTLTVTYSTPGSQLQGIDIGTVGFPGSTSFSGGVYTVKGSGGDIYDNADGFHYAYTSLTGDGEIRARITSQTNTDGWAKAGVMVRSTTSPSALHGTTFMAPIEIGNGFEFISRLNNDGYTGFYSGPGNNAAPNNWVRIVRTGNILTGYASSNGTTWTLIRAETYVSLPSTMLFGLATCSATPAALCTATYDNVLVIGGGTVPPPAAPTGLTASATGGTTASISWTDVATNETNYRVERATGTGAFTVINTIPAGSTNYADTGLAPSTTYQYKVSAINADGAGTTGPVSIITSAAAPASPTGLTASATGTSTVSLSWTDVANNETNYSIERATGTGAFSVISTIPAGSTSYADSGLTASTAYHYKVSATNTVGSGTAGPVSVTTLAAGGITLTGQDIGVVGLPGTTTVSGGVYTIRAAGTDIYGNADGFHFASTSITGDVDIRARVTSITNVNDWAKAAVMVREGVSPGARHAYTTMMPIETGNGFEMLTRTTTGGGTDYFTGPGNNAAPNNWVRVKRVGNVLTGYASANGTTWTQIQAVTYTTLPATMQVGLAVCSVNNFAHCTATFDNVQILTGAAIAATALNESVGSYTIGGSLSTTADGLSFTKSAGSSIYQRLQVIGDLMQSPSGWQTSPLTATSAPGANGSTSYTYPNLANALTGAQGFARIRIEEDMNGDGTADLAKNSDVFGFIRRTLTTGTNTVGIPFAPNAIHSAPVASVAGNALTLATQMPPLPTGKQCYVEITRGVNEGHRFDLDEAASTSTQLVIDPTSKRNTQLSVPASLAGDTLAIRAHRTVSELFPTSLFTGTRSTTTSDRILFYNGTGYEALWLVQLRDGSRRWTSESDATLSDLGTRIIDATESVMLQIRGPAVSLVSSGTVRRHDLALPLRTGNQLIANTWPGQTSLSHLGLTAARGLVATSSPTSADRVLLLAAEGSITTSYRSLSLLLASGNARWADLTDANLTSQSNAQLIPPMTGFFLKTSLAKPLFTVPMTWVP